MSESIDITFYGYIAYYSIIVMVCSFLIVTHSLRLVREFKRNLKDIFRIIQIFLLIEYLVSLMIIDGVRFINNFKYYTKSTFAYTLVGFYLSDLTNITCWVTLSIHTKYYTNREGQPRNNCEIEPIQMELKLRKIRKYEYFIMLLVITYIVVSCTAILGFNISYYIFYDCSDCSEHHNSLEQNCESKCLKAYQMYQYLSNSTSIIGAVVVILKVMVTWYVLYLLKNHLNFYYKLKKNKIIAAMFLSIAANITMVLYSFVPMFSRIDLKSHYDDKISMSLVQLSYGIILPLIFRLLPIFLLVVNIQGMYFLSYMKNIMKGCNIGNYLKDASIFIRSSKKCRCFEDESEKSCIMTNNKSCLLMEDNEDSHEASCHSKNSFCNTHANSLIISEVCTENSENFDLYKKEYENFMRSDKNLCSTFREDYSSAY
ncbi:unnamed protein product [Moneuplotes crassus]|uniref:Uncharacterized protein n=1 Tax=Euplotes crassus TaxID=5936 RepID=A0AAD1UR46_EUPCR|nr:unnamed protein product [Moneuplotes crassus]